MKINVSHKVKSVERKGDEVIIKADDKKGNEVEFKADYCLVSVGRRPFTDGLKCRCCRSGNWRTRNDHW
jgi:dihydrolipoamide dehydrogenase